MAAKRLNKTLVVALSLVFFTAAIVVSVVALSQLAKRDPKYFVELAEQAADREAWQQAAMFYQEAYERSRSSAHLVNLSEMLVKDGDVRTSMQALNQALVNDPSLLEAHETRLDLLMRLARVGGALSDWTRLREAADKLLELGDDVPAASRAAAHHARGLALIRLESQQAENVERGLSDLEVARELSPESTTYAIDLAMQYVANDREKQGVALFQELLDREGAEPADQSAVQSAWGRFLASKRAFDDADKAFAEGVRLAEGDTEAKTDAELDYGSFLMRQWARSVQANADESAQEELFDRSEGMFKDCIERDELDYRGYFQLAQLYKAAERFPDILDVCEQRLALGLDRKGVEASENRISHFGLMILASEACTLEATVLDPVEDAAAREEWISKAEKYLADARGEIPNHPRALSQSGQIKVAKAEYREAVKDLRAADAAFASFDRIDWDSKLMLARTLLRLGEAGAARDVLTDVLGAAQREQSRSPRFWITYAQALLETGSAEEALALLDRILLVDAQNVAARRLKAVVLERQGKLAEAAALIEETTGDTALAVMLAARQASMEQGAERAIRILREGLEDHPGNLRIIRALVSQLVQADRVTEATEVLDAAVAADPDQPSLRALRVVVEPDLSIEEREAKLIEALRDEPDAFKRAVDLLAYFAQEGDEARSLEYLEEAIDHLAKRDTPIARTVPDVYFRSLLATKARLAASADRAKKLDEVIATAAREDVDRAGGDSVRGLVEMVRGNYSAAEEALRRAVDAVPSDSWAWSQLGRALIGQKRFADAKTALEQASRLNPRDGEAQKGLAMIALAQDDRAEFARRLALAEELLPGDEWIARAKLARSEFEDPLQAIERRRELAQREPEKAENWKRLAPLLERAGDTDEARDAYMRWVELAPDSKDAIVGAAGFLRRSGDPSAAEQLIRRFIDSRSDARDRTAAHIILASHFIDLGSPDRAEQTLLTAAEKNETVEIAQALAEYYMRVEDEPKKAAPWIEKALVLAERDAPDQVLPILAMRVACALHHSVDDAELAKSTLTRIERSYPEELRVLLWRSQLAAREGNISSAVSLISRYIDRRPDDVNARFQQAQHYVTQGMTARAIEDLEHIRRIDPGALELRPRFLLASLYFRQDRRDDWLAELENIAEENPTSEKALQELSLAYIRLGKPGDADRIVTRQINKSGGSPDARWLFLRGRVSLNVGDMQKALADYRRAAELTGYRPESVSLVLGAYAQAGDFAGGAKYFEENLTDAAPAPVRAQYAALLARSGEVKRACAVFSKAMQQAMAQSEGVVAQVSSQIRVAFPTPTDAQGALLKFKPSELGEDLDRPAARVLVRICTLAGDYRGALRRIEALRNTAKNDPERAIFYQEMGELFQRIEDYESAGGAYRRSLQFNPNNWLTLNNYAYLLSEQLGDPDKALELAKQAAALVESASVLDTLGWIQVAKRKYREAVATLSKAVRLDPNDPLILFHLGEAYRRAGEFDEALSVLATASSLARSGGDDDLVADIRPRRLQASNNDATP